MEAVEHALIFWIVKLVNNMPGFCVFLLMAGQMYSYALL